jgi:hypothetical protein
MPSSSGNSLKKKKIPLVFTSMEVIQIRTPEDLARCVELDRQGKLAHGGSYPTQEQLQGWRGTRRTKKPIAEHAISDHGTSELEAAKSDLQKAHTATNTKGDRNSVS